MKNRICACGKAFAALIVLTGISACSDSDPAGTAAIPPPPVMATFEVTVSNLTNAQPLSPVGVVVHEAGFSAFDVGNPASVGLEMLAESGDNSQFLSDAMATGIVDQTASGTGVIMPGAAEAVRFTILATSASGLEVSLMTMLVNTNDAISGVKDISLQGMSPGESVTMRTIAYDAGTEANSESGSTVPGPAAGGEGFNATRDDIMDIVKMHAGVVTQDDGFATSALGEAHRFDNPVAQVTLTRTQ
jgi:hypothetical protein